MQTASRMSVLIPALDPFLFLERPLSVDGPRQVYPVTLILEQSLSVQHSFYRARIFCQAHSLVGLVL